MNSFSQKFKNLKISAEENRLGEIPVSSIVEICKSYSDSEDSIDSIDKTVEVINFFFNTRDLSDRMLLAQVLSLLQACLPRLRTFVSENLKKPANGDLALVLDKILTMIDMLQSTVTFFDRKFNWTSHHLTFWDFYINLLSILMEIFVFARQRRDQIMQKLIGKVSELYLFILEKLSSADISYFLDFSCSEREFLRQILGILFLMGEISPSIDPSLWAITWKNTHKIISRHSKELKRETEGSIECLEAPIKFICQQIREGIRDAVQRNSPKDTQKILKITKFYLSIITKLIQLFPGDNLPNTDMIMENLFYLQSVHFLKSSVSAEEVHKVITDEYMRHIKILQRNKQFIECLVNTNYSHYSHGAEIFAFLIISSEILRINGQENGSCPQISILIEKVFAVLPNCHSIFLDRPTIFQDLCKNISLILTTNYLEENRRILIDFIHKTLEKPLVFGTFLMLNVWRNIQRATRDDVRFETFVMWKNSLESRPRISSSVQTVLTEELLRVSFDYLSSESQHRVVSLNNPQEKYILWSVLGLNRIPSVDKRNFLAQRLSEKVETLINEFLERKLSVTSFENMILILKILANSSFTPGESFKRKYMEFWIFIDGKSSKLLCEILNPLLEMFRNIHNSLTSENVQKILLIVQKFSCIDTIDCLKVISERNSEIYWAFLRRSRNSSKALQLLASLIQTSIGFAEPEISRSPPSKRFKEDFGAKSEAKLRKILEDVEDFRRECPPGQSLPLESALLVREIIFALRKTTN